MKAFIYCSTVADDSMKSTDGNFASVLPDRAAFLQNHEINPADTTLVQVTYEADDFCRYKSISDSDKSNGIVRQATIEADALIVTEPGHALFLPLADCVGAVVHDPSQNILMVSHLGRHNLEQFGGTKCIEYLAKKHGSDPKDLTVWLSPAAGKANYPLYTFSGRSLHEVCTEQIITAGVLAKNITASPIDSSTHPDYFSHSQFLKGHRKTDGRHAIVAVMS